MSIPTVYIRGTKKDTNAKLAAGEPIPAVQYTPYTENHVYLNEMPDGTVIKFWLKSYDGTPIAQSYGNWKPSKNKVV